MGCQTRMLLQTTVSHETLSRHGLKTNTLTTSLEKKEMNSPRKNTRFGNYGKVDEAIYNWFVTKGSQKTPIDGIMDGFAKALAISVPWVYKNRDHSE